MHEGQRFAAPLAQRGAVLQAASRFLSRHLKLHMRRITVFGFGFEVRVPTRSAEIRRAFYERMGGRAPSWPATVGAAFSRQMQEALAARATFQLGRR